MNSEIKECERINGSVKQLVDSLNKDFIDYSWKAADENDPMRRRALVLMERRTKMEVEKDEEDVAERVLEITLASKVM